VLILGVIGVVLASPPASVVCLALAAVWLAGLGLFNLRAGLTALRMRSA